MDETLYKAPETEVANQNGIFYVVSLKKIIILFVATLALYAVYWFYKNWSLRSHPRTIYGSGSECFCGRCR